MYVFLEFYKIKLYLRKKKRSRRASDSYILLFSLKAVEWC
jgi:hypothetical protein